MAFWNKFKKSKENLEDKSVAKQVVDKAEEKKAKKPKKAAAAKKGEKATEKIATSASKRATETILGPIVTEKTAQLSDKGVMVFRVAKNANRVMVRQAVRELYKVNPVNVNIINVRGKRVKFGRQEGKRIDIKKALVTLPKGTRIDIFEGV